MSIEGLNWARQCEVGSATRKFVLFALADRWNADTGVCWPSVAWICEFTELGERTVRRALDELEADGFIIHDGWFGRRADRQHVAARPGVGEAELPQGEVVAPCLLQEQALAGEIFVAPASSSLAGRPMLKAAARVKNCPREEGPACTS